MVCPEALANIETALPATRPVAAVVMNSINELLAALLAHVPPAAAPAAVNGMIDPETVTVLGVPRFSTILMAHLAEVVDPACPMATV